MRGVLALLILGGCYDPTISVGLPCGDGCPADLVCDRGICVEVGTPRVDATPQYDASRNDCADLCGDIDLDGVPDLDDNCPDDFNPDQHDEDDDTRGDPCDFCPHVFENQVQDADGDGVG